MASLVRIVIRSYADQRVGAVLAHDRNVVERYGDGRGHRVGAFRDGHNSTAGQTYRIDRTLQLRRDVTSARDSHQLAARDAARTFHSEPVSHIGKVIKGPLPPGEVDGPDRQLAVALGQHL